MCIKIECSGVGKVSNVEQFSASMKSIGSILGEDNYYAIPDMQRDYQGDIDKGKKHGRQLWNSIEEFTDEDPDKTDCYYLGTMIIYKDGNTWMVIDGQQRLTTLSMMFMVVRDIFDYAAIDGVSGKIKFRNMNMTLWRLGLKLQRLLLETQRDQS